MIKRFIAKVSDDGSTTDLINLISKMLGIDPQQILLSDEDQKKISLSIQNEKTEIEELINPFFDQLRQTNSKDNNKKIAELIDLGKFLVKLKLSKEVKILECNERPDFIVQYNDRIIGIEHTGIYDDEVVAEIRVIKKIIKKCQDRLILERSDITGFFNLVILPLKLNLQLKLERAAIEEAIYSYIIAYHSHSVVEKPGFLAEVIRTESSTLELELGEEYWLTQLTSESISKTIVKKEAKIEKYKESKNIDECWLLIVIDGVGSESSFDIKINKLPTNATLFDKLFLFENFTGRIFEGQKNRN